MNEQMNMCTSKILSDSQNLIHVQSSAFFVWSVPKSPVNKWDAPKLPGEKCKRHSEIPSFKRLILIHPVEWQRNQARTVNYLFAGGNHIHTL